MAADLARTSILLIGSIGLGQQIRGCGLVGLSSSVGFSYAVAGTRDGAAAALPG